MTTLLWIGSAVAGAGLLGAVYRIARSVSHTVRSLVHFLDDWFGAPARMGVAERPGVMARLHSFDVRLQALEKESS